MAEARSDYKNVICSEISLVVIRLGVTGVHPGLVSGEEEKGWCDLV